MDWLDDKRDEVLEDDYFIDAQFMANSRQEAIDLVGDDTFYTGYDDLEGGEEEEDYQELTWDYLKQYLK